MCDCGKEVTLLARNLRKGATTSCGCRVHEPRPKMMINMIGRQCGRLLVKSEAAKRLYHYVAWNCMCDCGTEEVVGGKELRNGDRTMCKECKKNGK